MRIFSRIGRDNMEFIESMIQDELNKASNFATRATVKLRVLCKIADKMGLSLREIYDTKDCIRVDPSIAAYVEQLWNGGSLLGEHFQQTANEAAEDYAVMEKFLAKDFSKPTDISRLTSMLRKRYPASPVLRILWFLFAVDGLAGFELDHYCGNLSIPLVLEHTEDEECQVAHVRAIRTIYRDVRYATPERVRATLRRLFDLEETPKKRHLSSVSSNESSDSGSDEDEENDRHIADLYKRVVGKKISAIAFRLQREVNRKPKKKVKREDDAPINRKNKKSNKGKKEENTQE